MTTQAAFRDDYAPRNLEALKQGAIDRLTEAFAQDYISMDEYERRAGLASAANKASELEVLTLDLPLVRPQASPGSKKQARSEPAPMARTNYDLVGSPPVTTGCIMGDRNMTGNWLTSDRVSSFTVMGSTKLDLRDVDLPPGPIRIEVFTLMGDTKIIVPRHLPVRMSAFSLMADSRIDRNVNQQTRGAECWVEVSGFVMMGDVKVVAAD
jgi:hypothetical protein